MAKFIIEEYDPKKSEPPYEFNNIMEFEAELPKKRPNSLGEEYYAFFVAECNKRGFTFRSWSMKGDVYYLLVWNDFLRELLWK